LQPRERSKHAQQHHQHSARTSPSLGRSFDMVEWFQLWPNNYLRINGLHWGNQESRNIQQLLHLGCHGKSRSQHHCYCWGFGTVGSINCRVGQEEKCK
jgi:hypothetical protein